MKSTGQTRTEQLLTFVYLPVVFGWGHGCGSFRKWDCYGAIYKSSEVILPQWLILPRRMDRRGGMCTLSRWGTWDGLHLCGMWLAICNRAYRYIHRYFVEWKKASGSIGVASIEYRYHAGSAAQVPNAWFWGLLKMLVCLLLFLNQFSFTNHLPKHSNERQSYVVEFGQSHTHFFFLPS